MLSGRKPFARRWRPAALLSGLVPAAIVAFIVHGCASSKQYGSLDIDNRPASHGPVATGPCAPEGATYACHEVVSDHDHIVTCFDGTQTCTGGTWGPCSGTQGTFATKNVASGWLGPNVSIKALSDAGSCTNPCDPACQVYNETVDGGISPVLGSGTPGGGSIPLNIIEAGLVSPCKSAGDCQFDYHCDIAAGKCLQNSPGYFTACGGVNLTAGPPCSLSNNPTFPICNRGDVKQPPFLPWFQAFTYNCKLGNEACITDADCCFRESTATSQQNSHIVPCIAKKCRAKPTDCLIKACSSDSDCCGSLICIGGTCGRPKFPATPFPDSSGSQPCQVTYPDPILKGVCNSSTALPALNPGECAMADFSGCSIGFQGETAAYINHDGSITECGQPLSPGCSDNWTYFKDPVAPCGSVGAYRPLTYSQIYAPNCPKGSRPQWGVFAYKATMRSDASGSTSANFQVRTAQTYPPDGGADPWGPLVSVAMVPTDPANCPLTGPKPCPKDLFAALGKRDAKNGQLELQVTLNPSPSGNTAPTLNSWNVTYTCVPSE